ncbi:MAG: hypothetical protein ACQERD_04120 [Campylobacterota bacterium]
MSRTLIHTTTKVEAKPIIDFFELEESQYSNYKIYSNNDILLIISGVSKDSIYDALTYIFDTFEISRAVDISTVYSCDTSIVIGTLFCTNRFIYGINFATVTTLNRDFDEDEVAQTLLVDKQEKYFKKFFEKKRINIDSFIFKVVSKYYTDEDLKSDEIYSILFNSCKKIQRYI